MSIAVQDEKIELLIGRAAGRIKWLDAGRGLALVFAGAFLVLLAAAVSDHVVGLGRWARIVFAVAIYVAVPVSFLILVVWPLARKVSARYAAFVIEKSYPEYRNSLMSFVELAETPNAEGVRKAIARKVNADGHSADLDVAIGYRDFLLRAYAMAAMAFLLGAYAIISEKSVPTALARVLHPLRDIRAATLTRIEEVKPGNVEAPEGGSVEVEARLGGAFPSRVELVLKLGAELSRLVAMERMGDDPRRWHSTVPQVSGIVTYRVRAGDAESPDYQIKTYALPVLESVSVLCDFPAYTGLEPVLIQGGNVSAIVGTKLLITASFNNLPAGAFFVTGSDKLTMTLNARQATLPMVLARSADYTIEAQDIHGQRAEPGKFHLEAVPDKEPTVAVTGLQAETVAQKWPEILPLNFSVSDDFGVARTELEYSVDGLPGASRVVPHPAPLRQFSGRYDMDLTDMPLKDNSALRFRLVAYDVRQPTANTGKTPWFLLTRQPPVRAAAQNKSGLAESKPGSTPVNDVNAERELRKAAEEMLALAREDPKKLEELRKALEQARRDAQEAQKALDKQGEGKTEPEKGGTEKPAAEQSQAEKSGAEGKKESGQSQPEKNAAGSRNSQPGSSAKAAKQANEAESKEKTAMGQKSAEGASKEGEQGGEGSKKGQASGKQTEKSGKSAQAAQKGPQEGQSPSKQKGAPGEAQTPSVSSGQGGAEEKSEKTPSEKSEGQPSEVGPSGAGQSGQEKGTQGEKGATPGQAQGPSPDGAKGTASAREGAGEGEKKQGEPATSGQGKGQSTASGAKGASTGQGQAKEQGAKASQGGAEGNQGRGQTAGGAKAESQKGGSDQTPGEVAGKSQGQSTGPQTGGTGSGQPVTGGSGNTGRGPGNSAAGPKQPGVGSGNNPGGAAAKGPAEEFLPADPWQNVPLEKSLETVGKVIHEAERVIEQPEAEPKFTRDLGWSPHELRQFVDKFIPSLRKAEEALEKRGARLGELGSRDRQTAQALKGEGFDRTAAGAARQNVRERPQDALKNLAGDAGENLSPEYRDAVEKYFRELAQKGKATRTSP